ncbi:cysteine hydrolase family protein [Clostridium niameyense]|nr:isochorismatase family cysteine hydrolase [Clostridium niameyense]
MKIDLNYNINFQQLKKVQNKTFKIDDKTVLFIIDMNNGFAKKGALYSDRVQHIIPFVVDTVKNFIKLKAPIIAFTDCHTKNSIEFKYYPEHCLSDTWESELVDELKEFKDNIKVIKKSSTNGFLEDETQKNIKKLIDKGYKNWVISGCCTDICVKQFAESLKAYFNKENLDLEVIIPLNAVETYDALWHNGNAMNLFSLMEMEMSGIKLVSTVTY